MKRIKKLRTDAGLTQLELAKKIGVARTTLTGYEKGDILPPPDKLQAIADVFGVSVDYVIGRYSLTDGEKSDVAQQLEAVLTSIDNDATFCGEEMTDETKALLEASIRQALEIARVLTRQ